MSFVDGLVVYDDSIGAQKWIAETYAGIYDCIPVHKDSVDVDYQDNFNSLLGWNSAGDGNSSATVNDGILRIETGTNGNYALVHRTITVDMDEHPFVQIMISDLSDESSWYLSAYCNGQTYWIPSWNAETGFYVEDLVKATGLTGSQRIQFAIGVQGGPNRNVAVDWFRVGKYGFSDHFRSLDGWSYGSPYNDSTFSINDNGLLIELGSQSSYGLAYRDLTLNLDEYSYITADVAAASGGWHVAIYDGTDTYRMYPDQQTGTFSWQIGKHTEGKRGIQNIQLQIVCDGGPSNSVQMRSIRIGRHPAEEMNVHNQLSVQFDLTTCNFTSDEAAYTWAIETLAPLTNDSFAYCVGDEEYAADSGVWQASSLDIAIRNKAFCFRLPPSYTDEEKKTLLSTILETRTSPAAIYGGWSNVFSINSEETFVHMLSINGDFGILSCGNNGSFHASVDAETTQFQQSRTITQAENVEDKYYIAFMAAEGDTFASADDFFTGNWHDPGRGTVPINWGWNAYLNSQFPGLAEYYRNTSTSNDYFFGDIPLGYSYLSEMPNLTQFATLANACYDQANIAVAGKWDTLWNQTVNSQFCSTANISALFDGIMPGAVDSVDGGAYAQVRTLTNGVPYVTTAMALMYPTQNQDGTPLTAEGLAQLIIQEAEKHEKPYFLKITPHTYRNGTEFDSQLATTLYEAVQLLSHDSYKVVKLDEFVGALKYSISFQEDFVYKSNLWNNAGNFTVTNGVATIYGSTNGTAISQSITVNATKHATLCCKVNEISQGSEVQFFAVSSNGTSIPLSTAISAPGEYSFDLQGIETWSGLQTITLVVVFSGDVNQTLAIDYIKIGNFS